MVSYLLSGQVPPPLSIVLLLMFWNFCPQGMNSNYSPWGWGQIYLLPQIYIVNIDKKVLKRILANYFSVQFSSVAQSCPTFCDPMNCSTPGLPVHHPEFTQTHVHRVCDAIQPSHPRLAHCLEHSFAVELFQILKGDAVKVLHSICQQVWKTHTLVSTIYRQSHGHLGC